jgi:uncharacterized protein with ACT and thioredoxin-like domain
MVGEANLAGAVPAVIDLPRAAMLALAGALMGGDIAVAVRDVRAAGIPVVELNIGGRPHLVGYTATPSGRTVTDFKKGIMARSFAPTCSI